MVFVLFRYSDTQIESIEDGTRETSQLYIDIVASLIAEISAMEGKASPVIITDLNKLDQFWSQVYKFIVPNGYPYICHNGAKQFRSLVPKIQVLSSVCLFVCLFVCFCCFCIFDTYDVLNVFFLID